jgi:hypothetical protein
MVQTLQINDAHYEGSWIGIEAYNHFPPHAGHDICIVLSAVDFMIKQAIGKKMLVDSRFS